MNFQVSCSLDGKLGLLSHSLCPLGHGGLRRRSELQRKKKSKL